MSTLYEIKDNRIHFVYCSLLLVYLVLSTIAFGNKENFAKTNYFECWISTYSLIIFFAIISFFFFHNSFYSIYYIMTIILLFIILTIQIFLVIENAKEEEKTDHKSCKTEEDAFNSCVSNKKNIIQCKAEQDEFSACKKERLNFQLEDAKKSEDRKSKLILNSINLSIVCVILILFILSFIYNKKEFVNELINVVQIPPASTPKTTGKDLGLLGSPYVLSSPFDEYADKSSAII